MSDTVDHRLVARLQKLKGLSWISDAPLFIDEILVERFFDAIVRPAYEHESVTEADEKAWESSFKLAAEAAAKVEVDKPTWIPDWCSHLKENYQERLTPMALLNIQSPLQESYN